MASGIFTLKQQGLALGQGAWTNQPPISVNYLVVAGGGSGGSGGGGGAGGLLQGSLPITPGTSYTVTVGGGGAGVNSYSAGNAGNNSVFGSITTNGGGAGSNAFSTTNNNGGSGGSGGGAYPGRSANSEPAGVGGQGVFGQGNAGGSSWGDASASSSYLNGAGGGGAGTKGLTGSASSAGNGGAGISSDISGIRTAYAGGGGGPTYTGSISTTGQGGAGGGGLGGYTGTGALAGSANTGGGGGGAMGYASGSGGSGIVIISYPGTTQWFTGGTLSYANGNVIHTFYSSGTLAPTAASNYVNTDYQITRSLRFNSADSANLSRTPSSNGNQRTATLSAWTKRGKLGIETRIFTEFTGSGSGIFWLFFNTSDQLQVWINGATLAGITSTQVFRDPSAWYHIVAAVDTTQATASDRIKLYVNGVQITAFSGTQTYYTQNETLKFNVTTSTNYLGYVTTGTLDGYMAEVNWIDGQALNPYSFGYYNPNTGVWSPLKYVGSYGTNGFYLNFSDNSNTTAATLGKDYSGNGNNWTPNNFSVTAGAGNDSLVDTPTPYGTDTGAGGEVRGNYCTLNPLDNGAPSSGLTLANGNLQLTGISSNWRAVRSTVAMSSGKWYCEATVTALSGTLYARVGLATSSAPLDTYLGYTAASWVYINTGNKSTNLSNEAYGASWTTNDVIGIAFDADAGTLTFYKNGVSQGQAFSGLTSGPYFFAVSVYDPQVMYFNFGQRPFAYTAPSGFKALCTQNLPTPTIGATSTTQADNYFNVVTRTFTAATAIISGLGFSPDWLWFKRRNAAASHSLFDRLRGTNARLLTNGSNAEITTTSAELTSFDSDGFTVGADPGSISINASNGDTGVVWCWRANGAGVSNTAGTITSTVSANTTSGFSVVTYTGNSTASATVGHGLGVTPSMIIVKNRSNASNWPVSHTAYANTSLLYLDSTLALVTTAGTRLQRTSSTVFTVGDGADYALTNQTGNNYVAYCFAAIAGYSAFGSYTGNGSTDGPMVFTGFRPKFLMIKCTSESASWQIVDAVRDPYNVAKLYLQPDNSGAEGNLTNAFDFLSNGFKVRTDNASYNRSSGSFVYAAFAEVPLKYSLAR